MAQMQYLNAKRKDNGETERIIKLHNNGETWFFVSLDHEVRAMTPGDFDMGYEIPLQLALFEWYEF